MLGALLVALALRAASFADARASFAPVLQVAIDVNDAASALALMRSTRRYDLQQVLLTSDERSLHVATTLFLQRFDPADLRHAPTGTSTCTSDCSASSSPSQFAHKSFPVSATATVHLL